MENTPGPWKIEYETDHDFLIVAPWSDAVKPGNIELFGDYRGGHVCNITFIDNASVPTERQALANAELIAQAPELKKRLEAAEARVAQAEQERDEYKRQYHEREQAITEDERADKDTILKLRRQLAEARAHVEHTQDQYINALDWMEEGIIETPLGQSIDGQGDEVES